MAFPLSHLDPFDTVWYTSLFTFDITLALNIRIEFSKDIVFLISNTCDVMFWNKAFSRKLYFK